ncbi:MAG: hypothetical protein ACTHNQ_03030 [Microbacterium sp.]|uniref:hypothetical protein n=1 Tax=Microbacterium sp. TaxID=51671 RepID=UPI003F81A9F7
MARRSLLVVGSLVLALSLAGCATPRPGGALDALPGGSDPAPTPEPTATLDPEAAAARAKAQGWLDAVNLPPGAEPTDLRFGFNSYTGWPCGPVEELEGYWMIPDMTVLEATKWIRENPTADLITTAVGPPLDDPAIEGTIVGYIPAPGAQEGIVYTLGKSGGDVAVRAEVAALTASAVCPPLPDGGQYGAPGQG